MQNPNAPIVNTLPATVILVFLPMVLIEGYFAGVEAGLFGSKGVRVFWVQEYGYWPAVTERAAQTGAWGMDVLIRFFSFNFINIDFLGTIFSGVMTLALGKFVADSLGEMAFVAIFFLSAIFGALIYTFLSAETFPLVGAFPAAFGLIGAFSFVLFTRAGGMLTHQLRAFQLLGVLMVLNWIFTLFFGAANTWIAELAAALFGFATAALLRPGGVQILLNKIRRG